MDKIKGRIHVCSKQIMTDEQIDRFNRKVATLFAAGLRESHLLNEVAARVFDEQVEDVVSEFLLSIRRRTEAVGDLIVRRVKVDRGRSPMEALLAAGYPDYYCTEVVERMPRGRGDLSEVFFFHTGVVEPSYREIDDDQLEHEYTMRGLKPIDPYSLAAVNEADKGFAGKFPNATHWKQGVLRRWCRARFTNRSSDNDSKWLEWDVDYSHPKTPWSPLIRWFAGEHL
ncbi:MAG TPA: hypothetical protein VG102_02380 [Candidatus Paceibacterota bacterium]|jgi:hypothetical protein|nr:hypothetical protein [Candidatus Paceibacterota bacterium]